MNKIITVALTSACLCAAAGAQPVYNTSVTPGWFVGTGQPNANFVVDNNSNTGIETGLSSFYRFDGGQNSIVNNTYEFNSGNTYPPAGTAAWNFNYHANLATGNPGLTVSTNLVLLTIDWDPSAGTDLRTYNYSALAIALGNPSASLLQGSENLGFSYWTNPTFLAVTGSSAPSVAFNPYATGTYTFNLTVMNGGVVSSSVDMFVNVVPAPGAAAALGLAGASALRRRRR